MLHLNKPNAIRFRQLTDSEFEELVVRAKHGSREAMDELFHSCRRYLMSIADRELDRDLRSKVGPSDVVQSSVMDAAKHIGEFRGKTRHQFLAWVRNIVLNRVVRKRRDFKCSAKRNINRERPITGANASSAAPLQIADNAYTPCTAALQKEILMLVGVAVTSLPKDYQQVIRLRKWEQLTLQQIAVRMNRSEAACQKLWQRATESLRKELENLQVW